jgi:transcriptional regulator with XRE-family HTH domain
MADPKTAPHEWSERILRLASELGLTQAGLAERLGVSPATVSRWIKGKYEPTAEGYVALGNLSQGHDGIYFWERAGVDTSAFPEATFQRAQASLRVSLHDFNLITSRKLSTPLPGKGTAVAIPLLNVSAYGDPVPPSENVSLSEVKVQEVLLAPLSWCPHPEHMISMHLAGDSMVPTISPGSIIFVDTAAIEREDLNQKITVVSHRDLGFKVARLQRLANSDVLVSSNYKYVPLDISNASKWKIFGQVLWWVSRDVVPVSG